MELKQNKQILRPDLVSAMGDDELKYFNTYRNWGLFQAFTDPYEKQKGDDNKSSYENVPIQNWVVKSLFNSVKAVSGNTDLQIRLNQPLLDSPEMRRQARVYNGIPQDCSVGGLVRASEEGTLGRQIYTYADFMYCKYLGRVSNNYLITLRRFPYPCGDHINLTLPDRGENSGETQSHMPDVGRLVTWMGTPGNEMSNILKYTVKMPFSELKSEIQDAGDAGGDSGGPLGTFLNATTNSRYQQDMVRGIAGSATQNYLMRLGGPFKLMDSSNPYSHMTGHQDRTKTYGPLDVIASTHKRDTGLEYSHDISLCFDYELRSYDGINGRAAFMDLLANILAVTYATGDFWGGGYRGSGSSQSNLFANLPIYKLKGTESWSEIQDSFLNSGSQILSALGAKDAKGNFSLAGLWETVKKGALSALLGGTLNALGRPKKAALNSLLTPAPVGYWHVTIGNPWHPIISMGNMILDGADIEHYGPLGMDDFPTGLKVTVKLKPAKGKDATLIEQMYTYGENRVYTPMDDTIINMYNTAPQILQTNKLVNTDEFLSMADDPGNVETVTSPANSKKTKDQKIAVTVNEYISNHGEVAKNIFRRYFGLSDALPICIAGKEAGFGSCKPKKKSNNSGNAGKPA